MSRRDLIAKLRAERFIEGEVSTPRGVVLAGAERDRDIGYAGGWNACSRAIERWLQQGDVEAGLDELVENAPREVLP